MNITPLTATSRHQSFIASRLPNWLLAASPATRRAYQLSARNELDAVRELNQATADLQAPADFVRPLLTQAIKLRFGLDIDVDTTEWVQWGHGTFIREVHRRSLLEISLANFTREGTTAANLGDCAVLPKGALYLEVDQGKLLGKLPRIGWTYNPRLAVPIKPHQFAALCRELDLGSQYEAHIKQVYKPVALYPGDLPGPGMDARVTRAILNRFSCSLECDARTAQMRNHISEAELHMLLQVASMRAQPQWHGSRVHCQELRLLCTNVHAGYLLSGAMLFQREGFESCVAYLPGDPRQPLKSYPHIDTFIDDLRPRLGTVAYSRFVQGYTGHAQTAAFKVRLDRTLFPEPVFHIKPVQGVFDPTADIGLQALRQPLPAHLLHYTHVTRKLWYDGVTLVVPTADVDRQAHEAMVKHYLQAGLSLLTVASLFVPGVGEVMAVVGAGQLLNEIFVGIDDWQHGQTAEALEHLFSVGENVVLMAAGGAALHAASSGFVEDMIPVLDGAGRKRLFYPKMERLRSTLELPPAAAPNALGQYEIDGKPYARVDGHLYQQRLRSGQYSWETVPPPEAPQCFTPLRNNGAGAWTHAHERPLQWPGEQVMGRWGPIAEGLPAEGLDFARRASGVSEDSLRRLHEYGGRIPGLLEDALQRQRLLQEFDQAVQAVRDGHQVDARPKLLVNELPGLPGWPRNLRVQLGSAEPPLIYGEGREPAGVLLTEGQVRNGELADEVVQQLTTAQRQQLFGSSVTNDPAIQAQTLRERLAHQLANNAQEHLATEYRQSQGIGQINAQWLRRDFPGLPRTVADDIARNATPSERATMHSARRVPLRLAEQACLQLREVRITRACEGLVRDEFANPDRDTLVFALLQQLQGWSNGLRLELREGSLYGKVLAAAGSENAQEVKFLVRHFSGYTPYDGQRQALSGSADLFSTLLRALPDRERQALQLNIFDAPLLRGRLTELALADRQRVAEAIGIRIRNSLFRQPMQVNEQLGYPMSGRGNWPDDLRQRLVALFPGLDGEQLSTLQLSLLAPGETLANALLRLETEWQTLEQTLQEWIGPEPGSATANNNRDARIEITSRLRRLWRRDPEMLEDNGVYYDLDLGGHAPGALPPITASFPHVHGLYMDEMQLVGDASAFLSRFPNARNIDLSSNRLTSVPGALSNLMQLRSLFLTENSLVDTPGLLAPLRGLTRFRHLDLQGNRLSNAAALFTDIAQMNRIEVLILSDNQLAPTVADFNILAELPNLAVLDLSANQITLDAAQVSALARCTQLRQFGLSQNVLINAPNVSQMSELNTLRLNNTSINEWPPGLSELMQPPSSRLIEIQLAGNLISAFPPLADSGFIALRNAETGQSLRRLVVLDNPFSPQSVTHLRAAGVPLTESVIRPQVDNWLTDCPPALRELIEQAAGEPNNGRLFQALGRVTSTRMYMLAPAEVRARMWALAQIVLEPAAQAEVIGLTGLREQLETLAVDATDTCEDGIALILNRFETVTMAWRAAAGATGEGEQMFEPLVQLSDRLFRMDLVDDSGMRITRARAARLALRDSGVAGPDLPALDSLDDISEEALAHGVDEVEVRLFLLEQLRVRLELPQPATAMRYETVVSNATVTRVGDHVSTQATRLAMGSWIIEQATWRPYLEHFYAQQFGELQARWALGMELFETAISADEILDIDAVMPTEVLNVLQQDARHVVWVADGLLQHVELDDGSVLTVYQALAAGRERQLAALRLSLTAALLERFSRLPQ